MTRFFSHLRYSYGNEDWRTEEIALDIRPQDHVLCITASGDRPLNLLTRPCKKMFCVDANPMQNHLLALKAAAMQVFDHATYLAFLGGSSCTPQKRKELLLTVLPHLSKETAAFWTKHKKKIAKGILYQGSLERLTRMASKIFALGMGKKIRRLFAMDDLEEQRRFVREEWDTPFLRRIFNLILNNSLLKFVIDDPGLTNFSKDLKPGDYIYDRILASLNRDLAKKNPLLSLIFQGKVSPEGYSPHLTGKGTHAIKKHLSTLNISTANILDYLESHKASAFDVFSLSDVPSYLTYKDFTRLLENMLRTAKPGARFCLRQFLSSYEIPNHLKSHFVRNQPLEKELESIDNCSVFRFMVGNIVPA